MGSRIPHALHIRFWDFPLKPELLVQEFPKLLEHSNKTQPLSAVLDFGSTFPWSTEPRLGKKPVYPEECLAALAKKLNRGKNYGWYIPLDPFPWKGDLRCYDSINRPGNQQLNGRFLQELVDDVKNIGFQDITLCIDPKGNTKDSSVKEMISYLKTSGLPYWILPKKRTSLSAALALLPDFKHTTFDLLNKTRKIYTRGCQLLEIFGSAYIGAIGGYTEKNHLEKQVLEFVQQVQGLEYLWVDWVENHHHVLMAQSPQLVMDSKLYGVRALHELIQNRYQEYLRFRQFLATE